MPEVSTELEFGSVFQLLVAVILSAQCTDKRINQVTPELFRHYPDAKTMAQAEPEEVLEYISSVSYPNAKADHLVKMARALVEHHAGEVPSDMNALLDLPGVGRNLRWLWIPMCIAWPTDSDSSASVTTPLSKWNRN